MLVVARVLLSAVCAYIGGVAGGAYALLMHGPFAGLAVLMVFCLLGAMVAPDVD